MSLPRGRCDYCPAEIIWAVTAKNVAMALDAGPHPNGNVVLRRRALGAPLAVVYGGAPLSVPASQRFMPHWATCPNAELAREAKRRRRAPAPSASPADPPNATLF